MQGAVQGEALTTYDISPDGSRVRFNVRDAEGRIGSLELAANCLNQLLMSLPGIIQQSLQRNHGDTNLRLVYPLGAFKLELGEKDERGIRRYLLTLQTDGTFEISFAVTGEQIGGMAQTVVDHVLESNMGELEPVTLNS